MVLAERVAPTPEHDHTNPELCTERSTPTSSWRLYVNSIIGAEISAITRYFSRTIQWARRKDDDGLLLDLVECDEKRTAQSIDEIGSTGAPDDRTAILINGNLNYSLDVQGLLSDLKPVVSRHSRIIAVIYNPYLRWVYSIATWLGIRQAERPETFLTLTDLENLTKLSGYEIVRVRTCAYVPSKLAGLGGILNRVLPAIPFIRWFGLAAVVVLRPIIREQRPPSISVIIPARNEKGNIESALRRMPLLNNAQLEVIFVEGHSTDGTWEEIQRTMGVYCNRLKVRAFRQTGKGKCDAVRLGFEMAHNELLVILDADLTMPPELLHRFYDAYTSGLADFINGSRLVYPMEGKAMRFLNRLGNIFFAKALSAVLGSRIGDSLCGTKLVTKTDYNRMTQWRTDFGDFDPFGDFELLFPAAELGLGIVDVPIRYRDRVYGSTNISRFRHGLMLLRMTIIGLLKIRTGKVG